jgi:hypothetical protein
MRLKSLSHFSGPQSGYVVVSVSALLGRILPNSSKIETYIQMTGTAEI